MLIVSVQPSSASGVHSSCDNMLLPMTMEDWAKRIDIILEASGDEILNDAGRITAEFAKEFAETEFEKYRVIQDRLFSSDFDKLENGELPELPFEV